MNPKTNDNGKARNEVLSRNIRYIQVLLIASRTLALVDMWLDRGFGEVERSYLMTQRQILLCHLSPLFDAKVK